MAVSDGFVEFVLEQLEAVGPVTPKRMFGGVGLYAGDLFFALLSSDDVLYLKTDQSTRATLERAGAHPFRPFPDKPSSGTMQYYSVPAKVLEDQDELVAWAKAAVTVARAQRLTAPKRPRTSRRAEALRHTAPGVRPRRQRR
jgi:DNA transformation protein and related proteins